MTINSDCELLHVSLLQSLQDVDLGKIMDKLRETGRRATLEPAESTVFGWVLSIPGIGDSSLGNLRPEECHDIPPPTVSAFSNCCLC